MGVAMALAGCGGGGGSQALPPPANPTATPAGVVLPSGIWVAAWADAASHSKSYTDPPSSEQTFRAIVKPSVGSRGTIRLHFSNSFGQQPLTLGAVHVALQGTGAAVQAASDRAVSFAGSPSVTIPAGGTVTSDPLPMSFSYGAILAVTEYLSGSWPWLPNHGSAAKLVTGYQTATGAGNQVADLAGTSFTQQTTSVNVLDRVDVLGNYKETVAFIGSSTTDGYGADANQFDAIYDDLAARLHAAGRDDTAVVNMAITPNALLPADEVPFGELSILERFQRDVAALPGIGVVIQNGGDVDLKFGSCVNAATIIPGEQQFIAMAHSAGIRVLLPSVAPATWCGNLNSGPQFPANTGSDAERNLLNAWITSTVSTTVEGMLFGPPGADLYADFAGAVTDPNNQGYMLPQYAFDYSHPNAAGQAAEAATIPLAQL